jgi:hypothetical protein
MNAITNNGGPAFQCSRCGVGAVRKQGHQWLCARHYRIGQMRSRASRDGKAVPTHEQLETMWRDTCADCGVVMNVLSRDGERERTASLQHYRDGSLAVVCVSCNARHASMPGDTFRDMPKDHKRCPRCETIKTFASFSADLGRSGPMKLKSWCKSCASASHTEWQRNNREHYNAKQREARAVRRAAG